MTSPGPRGLWARLRSWDDRLAAPARRDHDVRAGRVHDELVRLRERVADLEARVARLEQGGDG